MPEELIIDDNNGHLWTMPQSQTGYVARDFERTPYGAVYGASAADIEIIPMQEWPDRIADLERGKATLKDVWADTAIGVWDQDGYPFCHGYAAAMAVALQRAYEGLPFIALSASSVAAPVTGYKKAGAWIGRDLKQIIDVGVCSTKIIPMLTASRSDFKPGWEQDAAKCKVSEFGELRPRDFKQQGSALLLGFAVSVGQNHWNHAVDQVALRDMDKSKDPTDHNRYGTELINSWSTNWGNGGFAIQMGSKKFADEAYIVRQVVIG